MCGAISVSFCFVNIRLSYSQRRAQPRHFLKISRISASLSSDRLSYERAGSVVAAQFMGTVSLYRRRKFRHVVRVDFALTDVLKLIPSFLDCCKLFLSLCLSMPVKKCTSMLIISLTSTISIGVKRKSQLLSRLSHVLQSRLVFIGHNFHVGQSSAHNIALCAHNIVEKLHFLCLHCQHNAYWKNGDPDLLEHHSLFLHCSTVLNLQNKTISPNRALCIYQKRTHFLVDDRTNAANFQHAPRASVVTRVFERPQMPPPSQKHTYPL